MTEKRVLITSALPYVNNEPHLGNIIGCVLSADAHARFCRLRGFNTLFVCGTDEYGSTTEEKANELGLSPRQLCNKYYEIHKKIYNWFDISFDIFGRTSTENPKTDNWTHTKVVQKVFKKLVKNGFVIEKRVKQLYCTKTGKILTDRFVKGTCPFCTYDNAYGDQCDNCGATYSAHELLSPYNKEDPDAKIGIRENEELFLKLSTFKDDLIKWWLKQKDWTNVANTITKEWLNRDLQDQCITRNLEWGTPIPDTKQFGDKYKNKVFYPWFGAPFGYISITKHELGKQYQDWWKNPYVELVNFMAKDNVRFHSTLFPATIMGSGIKYNLVNKLSAIDYLMYEGKKFSKSRNFGIFGNGVMASGIDSDIWRFYLLKVRPENGDANFQWRDFFEKVNGELVNNFSNLVNRVLSMTYKNYKKIPYVNNIELFNELNIKFIKLLNEYIKEFNHVRIRNALNKFLEMSTLLNVFLNEHEPWKHFKVPGNPEHARNVLGIMCHFLAYLSVICEQFLPKCSDKIQEMMNISFHSIQILEMNHFQNTKLNKPQIIFKRLTQEKIDELQSVFSQSSITTQEHTTNSIE